MMTEEGKTIKELQEQLDTYHAAIKMWRDQWCRDGHEIAALRQKLRDFSVITPSAPKEGQ